MNDNISVNAQERIQLDSIYRNGERRIALRFGYNAVLNALARSAGAQWSSSDRCWHIADGSTSLKQVYGTFKGKAWIDGSKLFGKARPAAPEEPAPKAVKSNVTALGPDQLAALEALQRKLEIARYSPNTVRVYHSALKQLFLRFPARHPGVITTTDIETFQHELSGRSTVSNSYLNQMVNAIRYYYKDVLGDVTRVNFIERPRKEKKLPKVLSEAEVTALLRASANLKHRCILMLIYSSGLRLNELVKLKVDDIVPDRGQVIIQGKGRKERVSIIGKRCWRRSLYIKRPTTPRNTSSKGRTVVPTPIRVFKPFSTRQKHKLGSPSLPLYIPCDIPLPHICWKKEPIFVIFKPSLATVPARRPRSTPMSVPKPLIRSVTHWMISTCDLGFTYPDSRITPNAASAQSGNNTNDLVQSPS